jgi:hypothetical protein
MKLQKAALEDGFGDQIDNPITLEVALPLRRLSFREYNCREPIAEGWE